MGDEIPVFDLTPFLELRAREERDGGATTQTALPADAAHLCADLADCFASTGCVVVRDPRVSAADNGAFLDLMERYFAQAPEDKRAEERPELHYQIGVTPEGVEVPRCQTDPACIASIMAQPEEHRAQIPNGPDPKWRYFWRIGERPAPSETKFAELNASPVVPKGFPEWAKVMDRWGEMMTATVEVVAEMSAVGFGLPQDAFTSRMRCGPHLLAPTGTDLAKHHQVNQIFAGYHYDLNFLTIHGKARFPGLYVWLRNGHRVPVKVPDGCLLLQAGKQMEWLTGGHVRAGYHEVIFSESCARGVEEAQGAGRSLWRVSSTLFGHIASDVVLEPLGPFKDAVGASDYAPVLCGDFVSSELEAIALKA